MKDLIKDLLDWLGEPKSTVKTFSRIIVVIFAEWIVLAFAASLIYSFYVILTDNIRWLIVPAAVLVARWALWALDD